MPILNKALPRPSFKTGVSSKESYLINQVQNWSWKPYGDSQTNQFDLQQLPKWFPTVLFDLRCIHDVCPNFHASRCDIINSLGKFDFISTPNQTCKNSVLQNTYKWILTCSNKQIFWFLIHKINRSFHGFYVFDQGKHPDKSSFVGKPTLVEQCW